MLTDIIIGLVGALAGGFLMGLLGFKPEGGMIYYTIIVAVFGAVILTWIYRKVTAKKAWAVDQIEPLPVRQNPRFQKLVAGK